MSQFDKEAETWDHDPQKVERAEVVADLMRRMLPITREMIGFEYGCGTGLLSFALQPYLKHITLADRSQEMLKVVKGKIQSRNVKNMTLLHLDLTEERPQDKAFDLVYTLMTLHHIHDTDQVLERLRTLVKRGGHLCIVDLDKDDGFFHDKDFDGHNGFDRNELKEKLEEIGFSDIRFETCYTMKKEIDGEEMEFPLFLLTCTRDMNDNAWFLRLVKIRRVEEAEKLAAAKEEAARTGKEAFDFQKLCSIYDPSPLTAPADWEPTEETVRAYEYKYYVYYPHIKTIEEFARQQEEMDLYDS